jgi:hypothetical protein
MLFVVDCLVPPAPLLHLDNTTSTYLRARHPTGNVAVKSFNVHTSTSDSCELITEHRHHRSVRTDTLSHKSLCLRATPHNIISHRRSGNRRYGPGLSESPRHLHNHRHMRIVIPAYHSATGAVCSFTLDGYRNNTAVPQHPPPHRHSSRTQTQPFATVSVRCASSTHHRTTGEECRAVASTAGSQSHPRPPSL